MVLSLFNEVDSQGDFTLRHNVRNSKSYIDSGEVLITRYDEFGHVRATQGIKNPQHHMKTNNLGYLQPTQTKIRQKRFYNMLFEEAPKLPLPSPADVPPTNSEIEARNIVLPDGVPVNSADFTTTLLNKDKIRADLAAIAREHQILQFQATEAPTGPPVFQPHIEVLANGEVEVKEAEDQPAEHEPTEEVRLLREMVQLLQREPVREKVREKVMAQGDDRPTGAPSGRASSPPPPSAENEVELKEDVATLLRANQSTLLNTPKEQLVSALGDVSDVNFTNENDVLRIINMILITEGINTESKLTSSRRRVLGLPIGAAKRSNQQEQIRTVILQNEAKTGSDIITFIRNRLTQIN